MTMPDGIPTTPPPTATPESSPGEASPLKNAPARAPATSDGRLALAFANLRKRSQEEPAASATPAPTTEPPAPPATPPPEPPGQDWQRLYLEALQENTTLRRQMTSAPLATQAAAPAPNEQPEARPWAPSAIVKEMARTRLGEHAPDWQVTQLAQEMQAAIATDHLSSASMLTDEQRAEYQREVEQFAETGARWDTTQADREELRKLQAQVEEMRYQPERTKAIGVQREVLATALTSDEVFRAQVPALAGLAGNAEVAQAITDLITAETGARITGRVDEAEWNGLAGTIARRLDSKLGPVIAHVQGMDPTQRGGAIELLKVTYDHPGLHKVFDSLAAAPAPAAARAPAPPRPVAQPRAPAPVSAPGRAAVEYGGLQGDAPAPKTTAERRKMALRRLYGHR